MEFKTLKDLKINIEDGDRGKHYPTTDEFSSTGYCLFLNNKNIINNRLNLDYSLYITRDKHLLLGSGSLNKNDIVLTTRGTLGNSLFIDGNFPLPARINSGMIIIHPTKGLKPKFLFYFFQSKLFLQQIISFQSGAAQPQLPIRDFKKLLIPIYQDLFQQHIINNTWRRYNVS